MIREKMHHVTFAAAMILCLFTFTAFSLCSVHHILMLFAGGYFTYLAVIEKKFKLSPSAWALVAMIVICLLSVIFNWGSIERPLKNIGKLKYFVIPLLGISALSYWFREKFSDNKVKWALRLFIISTTVASISGLIGYYTGFNPLRFKAACHASRTCGMYGMYMTYGYGIQFFVIIMVGLVLARKEIEKYIAPKWLYIAFAINFISFVLSFARGAMLGFLIALPFFFLKGRKKAFLGVAIAGILLATLSYFTVPKVKSLIHDPGRMHSVMSRISQWEAATIAAKENPILGLGYRNFEPNVVEIKKRHNLPYNDFAGHAHSNFFEHLASTGWIGLIALLAFHLLWFREAYKMGGPIGNTMMAFVVALFVSGQFQYTLGDGENVYFLMFIYMLFQVLVNKSEKA